MQQIDFLLIDTPGVSVWEISIFLPWLGRRVNLLFMFSAAGSKFGTRPDLQILKVSFTQARLTTSFKQL